MTVPVGSPLNAAFRRTASLAGLLLLLLGTPASAEISKSEPLDVRILLDNSGSMFPGYRPTVAGRKKPGDVPFFRELPEFRDWLSAFVTQQKIFNARTVAIAAFTYRAGIGNQVEPIQAPKPPGDVEVAKALAKVTGYGSQTYLVESLRAYTDGFEGLVWLITDNIVETGTQTPDEGVLAFFAELRDNERYRSVHLFKQPFEVRGRSSSLAIYGILVSREEIPEVAHFDRTFRDDFRQARQSRVPPRNLFKGQEHLKLKDLNIDALELQFPPGVEVEIRNRRSGLFQESQTVELRVPAVIRSNLTQHSVVGGRYRLSMVSPFHPDEKAREAFGIEAIPGDSFTLATGSLERTLPPTGTLPIEAAISSKEPVTLAPSGLLAWLKVAVFGVGVTYSGKATIRFEGIRVHLERSRMAGIFGVDETSKVFDFQDVQSLKVQPDTKTVSFALRSGSRRSLLLLFLLLVLGAPVGWGIFVLQKKASYRVTIGTDPPRVVGLRRLGRFALYRTPHSLGSLVRGLDGRHRFVPAAGLTGVQPSSTQPESYTASLPGGESVTLSIEPLDSGPSQAISPALGSMRRPTARASSPPAGAPLPPPAGASASPPPPGGASPSKPGGGGPSIRRPTMRRPKG